MDRKGVIGQSERQIVGWIEGLMGEWMLSWVNGLPRVGTWWRCGYTNR